MKKSLTILISAVLVVTSLSTFGLAKSARRPANDDLVAAAPIGELPFATTANTVGSSLETGEVQPTCTTIRSSVWYSITATEAGLLEAQLSSTFPAAVAVYEQTSDGLQEIACTFDTASSEMEFELDAHQPYLVQVGATGAKQGRADLSLVPSTWKEVSLFEQTFEWEREEEHVPVLSFRGAPRETDSSMYDVSVQISEQTPIRAGILTFGLVTQKIERQLVTIPRIATAAEVRITGRYDSSQYTCAADDGNGTCHAGTPLKDLGWLTEGGGSRAELVVTVRAEFEDKLLVERTQTVPYAGQILGLLP